MPRVSAPVSGSFVVSVVASFLVSGGLGLLLLGGGLAAAEADLDVAALALTGDADLDAGRLHGDAALAVGADLDTWCLDRHAIGAGSGRRNRGRCRCRTAAGAGASLGAGRGRLLGGRCDDRLGDGGPFTRTTGAWLLTMTGTGAFCAGASAGMSIAEGRLTTGDTGGSVAEAALVDAVSVVRASFEFISITPPNAAAPITARPATNNRPLLPDDDCATGA